MTAINGSTAVVTAGQRGLGKALAAQLPSRGATSDATVVINNAGVCHRCSASTTLRPPAHRSSLHRTDG
jgi:hypothetical protein